MISRISQALLLAILTMLPTLALTDLNELLDITKDKSARFIPLENPFSVKGKLRGNTAYIEFTIAPNHYIYKKQITFISTPTLKKLESAIYPESTSKFDPNFNEFVDIFSESFSIHFPIEVLGDDPKIIVSLQGCSFTGICYPPRTINIPLTNTLKDDSKINDEKQSNKIPEINAYEKYLKESSFFLSILLFFLAGIGLSFTPCTLPMIPIVSSLLLEENKSKQSRFIRLTLTYIISMSATFAIAGTLTGFFGASLNLQAKLQSPWVITSFSILFIILALNMFGLFQLQLPNIIREKITGVSTKRGTLINASLMGILSALVVSPCVSAPLAGALIYISTTEDALLGCLSLFALGIGMGIPLLVISIGGRHILPRVGAWMNNVQGFFGILLLSLAIWMLERIIPPHITLALWGTLIIGCAIALEPFNTHSQKGYQTFKQTATHALRQTIAIVLLIYGICLIIGFAKNNDNPLKPLAATSLISDATTTNEPLTFQHIYTLDNLTQALAQAKTNKKAVILDIYADWCISCKTIEKTLFPAPEIKPLLVNLTRIKLDITQNTNEHRKFMDQHLLFGPPAILFFDTNGVYQTKLTIRGEPSKEHLYEILKALVKI